MSPLPLEIDTTRTCVRCCHAPGYHDSEGVCHVSIQTADTVAASGVCAGKRVRAFETCKCAGFLMVQP